MNQPISEWAGTLKHEVRVWLIKKYEIQQYEQNPVLNTR